MGEASPVFNAGRLLADLRERPAFHFRKRGPKMTEQERFELLSCARVRAESAAAGKFARPGSKPSYAPDHDFDAEHILLELELDVPKKTVHGRCTTTFRAIAGGAREIRFDAAG